MELTFGDCVLAAAGNREFVRNIDRLRGTRFATMGQGGIGGMIDKGHGLSGRAVRRVLRHRLRPHLVPVAA